MSIQTAVRSVLALTDYRPSEVTNHAMSQLVESVIQSADVTLKAELSPNTIIAVRSISTDAETEMELYWSRRIKDAAKPSQELKEFPYINNYAELTRREVSLLASTGFDIYPAMRIAIIGSGPLPLSAIELHMQTGATIDHIDNSESALNASKELCGALGVDGKHYLASGQSVVLQQQYDVMLIAALAGQDRTEKQQILDNCMNYLSPGGRVILRSAAGVRELLYPAIRSGDLTGVSLLAEYHPDDYIINSVYIYGADHEA